MATVGMLTFHSSSNYGAVLQTAALASVLQQMGHEATVIDFRGTEGASASHGSPIRRAASRIWRGPVSSALVGTQRAERTEAFRASGFARSSRTYWNHEELRFAPPVYDAYVVGSDQVWNLSQTNGSTAYLLDFVGPDRRKVSYAASFGHECVSESQSVILRRHLASFDSISVRERSGVGIVKELLGRSADLVLDPTMLLTADEWRRQSSPSIPLYSPYLLVYHLPGHGGVTRTLRTLSRKIARTRGLEIIHVGQREHRVLCPWERNDFSAGPRELVSLIAGAAGVVTNSFHGTAFSIVFEKPFACVYLPPGDGPTARSGRITSLLQQVDLLQQGVLATDRPTQAQAVERFAIDYSSVTPLLEEARTSSVAFLERALSD